MCAMRTLFLFCAHRLSPVLKKSREDDSQEKASEDRARSFVTSMDRGLRVIRAFGERLALVADRGLAMMLARQHDMTPVSLH